MDSLFMEFYRENNQTDLLYEEYYLDREIDRLFTGAGVVGESFYQNLFESSRLLHENAFTEFISNIFERIKEFFRKIIGFFTGSKKSTSGEKGVNKENVEACDKIFEDMFSAGDDEKIFNFSTMWNYDMCVNFINNSNRIFKELDRIVSCTGVREDYRNVFNKTGDDLTKAINDFNGERESLKFKKMILEVIAPKADFSKIDAAINNNGDVKEAQSSVGDILQNISKVEKKVESGKDFINHFGANTFKDYCTKIDDFCGTKIRMMNAQYVRYNIDNACKNGEANLTKFIDEVGKDLKDDEKTSFEKTKTTFASKYLIKIQNCVGFYNDIMKIIDEVGAKIIEECNAIMQRLMNAYMKKQNKTENNNNNNS